MDEFCQPQKLNYSIVWPVEKLKFDKFFAPEAFTLGQFTDPLSIPDPIRNEAYAYGLSAEILEEAVAVLGPSASIDAIIAFAFEPSTPF